MAKKKKRDRGAAPQSASPAELDAPAPSAAAPSVTPETAAPAAGDRFDPFGSPRARLFANAFIALFLAYQVVMPLRYYMRGRGLDERFSWRMFSTVRMLECNVDIDEHVRDPSGRTHQRDVDLKKEVQVAWIGLLERGRQLVVEKLLQRRCEQEGVVKVDYYLGCVAPDGSKPPSVNRHMMCSDKQLREGRGAKP